MRIGLYPGTFDPLTLGHMDIISRATVLVDRLVIGVAINRDKGPFFSLEERVAMIEAECEALSVRTGTEIVVHPFENLLIDCARDVGAAMIIRGLRAVADFEYEYQMVGMNRVLDSSIETVFLMAEARYQAIASRTSSVFCTARSSVGRRARRVRRSWISAISTCRSSGPISPSSTSAAYSRSSCARTICRIRRRSSCSA
jgi:pantetheine-phosphate adenylyltransferase